MGPGQSSAMWNWQSTVKWLLFVECGRHNELTKHQSAGSYGVVRLVVHCQMTSFSDVDIMVVVVAQDHQCADPHVYIQYFYTALATLAFCQMLLLTNFLKTHNISSWFLILKIVWSPFFNTSYVSFLLLAKDGSIFIRFSVSCLNSAWQKLSQADIDVL